MLGFITFITVLFAFFEGFATDRAPLDHYEQLEINVGRHPRHLYAPREGWNPHGLPDITYLAAYLAY